jgi:hypothetical protein
MGGVEIVVPLGIAILFYLLFPAYLKNRQHHLVDRIRRIYQDQLIRTGEVYLLGTWLRYPAVIAVTSDYIIIRNALSLYNDEIPYERVRNIAIRKRYTGGVSHPEDDSDEGNILILGTTDQLYALQFEESEEAIVFRTEIEHAI